MEDLSHHESSFLSGLEVEQSISGVWTAPLEDQWRGVQQSQWKPQKVKDCVMN